MLRKWMMENVNIEFTQSINLAPVPLRDLVSMGDDVLRLAKHLDTLFGFSCFLRIVRHALRRWKISHWFGWQSSQSWKIVHQLIQPSLDCNLLSGCLVGPLLLPS